MSTFVPTMLPAHHFGNAFQTKSGWSSAMSVGETTAKMDVSSITNNMEQAEKAKNKHVRYPEPDEVLN
jgi:hypothetical protein